jgi:hypothetical protein
VASVHGVGHDDHHAKAIDRPGQGAFSELVDLAAREGVPLCTLDREMFVRGTACVVIPP